MFSVEETVYKYLIRLICRDSYNVERINIGHIVTDQHKHEGHTENDTHERERERERERDLYVLYHFC